MEVRKMTIKDIDRVLEIEKELYKDPWSKKAYEEDLTNCLYANNYVLEDDSTIIGFYCSWLVGDYLTINKVSISKKYQGKHLGEKLFAHLINEAIKNDVATIDLEVRESNTVAQSLYYKFGFIQTGIRKNYYANGENALLLVKELKEDESYEKIHISA